MIVNRVFYGLENIKTFLLISAL